MREPQIGQQVLYVDENRFRYVATVAYVHDLQSDHCDRFLCNLAIIKHDGKVAAKQMVEPAYHDGARWILLEKWIPMNEVDEDEFASPPVPGRGRNSFTTLQPSTK